LNQQRFFSEWKNKIKIETVIITLSKFDTTRSEKSSFTRQHVEQLQH